MTLYGKYDHVHVHAHVNTSKFIHLCKHMRLHTCTPTAHCFLKLSFGYQAITVLNLKRLRYKTCFPNPRIHGLWPMERSLELQGLLVVIPGITGFSAVPYSRVFSTAKKIPSAGSALIKICDLLMLYQNLQPKLWQREFFTDLSSHIFSSDVIVIVVFLILNA